MSNADLGAFLNAFIHDDQLKLVFSLIVADFVLGVVASLVSKPMKFRLSYISAFLRDDVLGKVLPWFTLFALGKANNHYEILGPIGFGALADAAFVAVTAALAASILKSVADFGIDLPESIAGSDPASYGASDRPSTG